VLETEKLEKAMQALAEAIKQFQKIEQNESENAQQAGA
jgi:Sec-independent protein translocase protein TatA